MSLMYVLGYVFGFIVTKMLFVLIVLGIIFVYKKVTNEKKRDEMRFEKVKYRRKRRNNNWRN